MSAVPSHAVTVLTPSVKTEDGGAPVTRTDWIDSEPSVSVRATDTDSGIGVSSVPVASETVMAGASASPTTTMLWVAGAADQTSPSETLKVMSVLPL